MKADSPPHRETPANLAHEFVIAIATLSRWSLLSRREFGDAEHRARALIFLPIIGLVEGVLFAFFDRMLAGSFLARSFLELGFIEMSLGAMDLLGVADLVDAVRIGSRPASTGLERIGPLGAVAAIASFVVAMLMLARIHDDASRSAAIVMSLMLSRWSLVPIAYGLRPLERWGLGVPYEGPIRFREFSASSAIALGLTMAFYENVGLVVIIALALTILALRLVLSRRLGGAAGYALAGGMAISKIVVLATMALLTH
jgi:cobalamin synthase